MTGYREVYSRFIDWYSLFFGAEGLIMVSERQIMDGSVPIYEFSGNINSFKKGRGAITLNIDQPDLSTWFGSITEWVGAKYGGLIQQNPCNICKSQATLNNGSR